MFYIFNLGMNLIPIMLMLIRKLCFCIAQVMLQVSEMFSLRSFIFVPEYILTGGSMLGMLKIEERVH